ncbi:cupin domain-containing protein [Sphaerisporangium sp. NPDC049003]|uniref:cupin domain-containing protein n=1 Tax=Sphaerisporangium sp. NPDC049003 TaxID=3364517 RepID=UPI00371807E0
MTATEQARAVAEQVAERLDATFRAQALRRTHQVFPGAVDRPGALLSFADLNEILACHRLEPPRLRLSVAGEIMSQHRYAQAQIGRRHVLWHQLQPAELAERLADGATLVLDAIDQLHPPAGALASAIESTLRTGVQVNAYASWTATEGFGIHWDDHDTFIVQIDGAKRWKIYGPTRLYPTFRDVEAPELPTGDPVDEFVLGPGDMLYVPRGHWHAVSASEGVSSLHLTCGLQTTTGAELLAFVADELREREIMRADLPQFDSVEAQAVFRAKLAEEVGALLDQDDLLVRFFTHRDVVDVGRLAPSLPYLTAVPAQAAVAVRLLTLRAHLDREGGTVRLRAGGQSWQFHAAAQPMLEALLSGASYALGELAELAALSLPDVAAVVSDLVSHQVAAVTPPSPQFRKGAA